MKKHELTLPTIAAIGGTRGMLGAGLALLLGDRLTREHRKTLGWTLFVIGAATTLPIARHVLRH